MPERRERRRRDSFKFNRAEIYTRVKEFYDKDIEDRAGDVDLRLQRHAKLRMWTEGKDWPFEDSSDIPLPDIATHSLRIKDTLHNAVMSARPVITSAAIKKTDKDKQETVDQLIDYQVFEEQPGEHTVGELAEDFVDDGQFTCFIPWVRETRETLDAKIFDPIPDEIPPISYFGELLRLKFPAAEPLADGWDWRDGDARISFYTRDDKSVEMIARREVIVYDGPKLMPKSYEQVLHPPGIANLKIPGPSNPGGAPHVILVDHPFVDEVVNLAKSGFYDLMTEEERVALTTAHEARNLEPLAEQKDDLRGSSEPGHERVDSHKPLTRLLCFDTFDIDGDGKDEDVIWTVILESKAVVRAKELTEVYPSNPPRRPLAEASFIPVRGRRLGIGMPELMEGLHDLMKQLLDQTIDAGTIANAPFWFYRAHSTLKPEVIRLNPGEGYPVPNPQQDVFFPQFPNRDQAFGLNMFSLLNTMEERLTMENDTSFGRVPPGSSSALRTIGGMSMLMNQGEARPERILRRFFMGLTEIWAQVHELNQAFLPRDKMIRITGLRKASDDPYKTLAPKDIAGRFQFMFKANVMNTSKLAMQQALDAFGAAFVSPVSVQLGTLRPDGFYRWLRDKGKSEGLDPDQYISEPFPGAGERRIFAEDAISAILNGQIPDGEPAEGAQRHLATLQAFMQGEKPFEPDDFGRIDTPEEVAIFKQYVGDVAQKADEERRLMQLSEAAGQGQQGQGQPGRPAGSPPDLSRGPVGPNELIDESLPGAGGGAVQ